MSVYDRVHTHGAPERSPWEADSDDDWETDPEPANLISEEEQRWGAATLPQDGKDVQCMAKLRDQIRAQDDEATKKDKEEQRKFVAESYGQKSGQVGKLN
eukprot:CAMPEP_0174263192 /NCGR_PEP_ID=MMETSP0439-20130205/17541_1 /TAXON_ID=0 /ORGANISM="Stereomyxa ramosa, Strain Chinc5" /LENGTH=99 /DNA_ID=CAMNT_0015348393 /DNA_START=18 /DNA_END=317 /DNA_ORIENTATION=-